MPTLLIVPNGVIGPHANPVRNRPILLLRQLLLDHKGLVGRHFKDRKLSPPPVAVVEAQRQPYEKEEWCNDFEGSLTQLAQVVSNNDEANDRIDESDSDRLLDDESTYGD
ncbi:hypothetical protein HAX54_016686 [Datura stramonium]|uniref:Uncharacterized protein n=1 Tax=Datura stramonium TaxID=4076 RepID=A0ABS8ULI6_DATST|nr:hypothetical protein [Datura stramonium]